MANLSNYPNIRPSLFLDFANSAMVDPRIECARATTATRTNAKGLVENVAANVPRIDYDPVTGECLGLLVEEARTNLFIQSDFGTGLTPTGLVTQSTMIGPSGQAINAAAFGYDGATSSNLYKSLNGLVTDSYYTISVYVRMDDGAAPSFGSNAGNGASNDFSFIVANRVAPPNEYKVVRVGANLYRVSVPYQAGANSFVTGIIKYPTNSSRTFKTSAWQIEAGAFLTSYIPTTTAAVTRAPDLCTMSGTNFTGWYKSESGTFVVGGDSVGADSTGIAVMAGLGDLNGASNRSNIYLAGGSINTLSYNYITNNIVQASINAGLSAAWGSRVNAGAVYSKGDFGILRDGIEPKVVASGDVASVFTTLRIGSTAYTGSGAGFLNGHVRRLAYYPVRLSNAQLQILAAP